MRLVIAEKPDMGRQIADVLGCNDRREGWREGNGWCVTWCFGHMVGITCPEARGDWQIEKLPILPQRFDLSPLHEDDVKGKRTTEDQIRTIRDLVLHCSEIVVATDAGREGELIFRNLYEYLGIRRPFRRLWLQALEPESIAEALRDLRPGSDYDNLAAAAKQREIADWLVGVNATRALTLAVGKRGEPLSLGRVQTPTLGLICERYIEHKTFKSVPYWYLQGVSTKDGQSFVWRSADRYADRYTAERDHRVVLECGSLTVESVSTVRKTENPPLLHDLASLQKEANARYRFSMGYTQDIAQSLYLKRLITYPRTESRYIPEVVFEKMPQRLCRHEGDPQYGVFVESLRDASLCRRSVDDTKVKDHHALLVTDTLPRELEGDERKVYGLILARMVEAFSPVCVADITTVTLSASGVRFLSRCRREVSLGWRAVMRGEGGDANLEDVDEIEMSMHPLPEMASGESVRIDTLDMIEDQTRPKPLYSDATLLTAMENAGSASDIKEVAEALRGVGIGTAATRKEIKEKLLKRKYIEEKNNRLLPTKLGMHVYNAVREKSIANVELTARWETALQQVAEGERDAEAFGQSIRKYTARVTEDLVRGGESFMRIKAFIGEQGLSCPRCRKGELRIGKMSAYCHECKFTIWRNQFGKSLSDESLKALATKGLTPLLTGFKNKEGETYDAYLRMLTDDEGRPTGETKREYPERKGGYKKR